jgi:hypothetical protein
MLAKLGLVGMVGVLGCGDLTLRGHDGSVTPGPVDAALIGVDAAVDGMRPSVYAVSLTRGDGFFTTSVEIGSQTFDMRVEMEASVTTVSGATCASCAAAVKYVPGTSASDLDQSMMEGTTGEGWTGEAYEDSATALGSAPVLLDFVSLTDQSDYLSAGTDGVLGLGPDRFAPSPATAFVTRLVTAGLQKQIAFRLCPGVTTSTLWLGGFDPTAATTSPSFTPMYSSMDVPFYNVMLDSAAIGATAVTGDQFGFVRLDLGSPTSAFLDSALTPITSAIASSPGYTAAFGSQPLTAGACLTTTMTSAQLDATLPALALTFGGATAAIPLAPHSYLLAKGGGQFCYAFTTSLRGSLLGASILSGMLTVIDLDDSIHPEIGFAPVAGCP